jgi:hypothetical protein
MSKRRFVQITVAVCLIALVLPVSRGWAAKPVRGVSKTAAVTLDQLYAKQLPLIAQTLANARKAVEMGHKTHALAELKKIEQLLAVVNLTLSQHAKPGFVNATCPIMGSKIHSERVTADLIREYKGGKVAFCCAGCPSAWDKLSDSLKQVKLQKAGKKSPVSHQGHMH